MRLVLTVLGIALVVCLALVALWLRSRERRASWVRS